MATKETKAEEKNVDPKGETVEVPKQQITDILKRLDTVEAENKRLQSAADVSRLAQYDNKNKPKELTRVRLNIFEDPKEGVQKVIMAWKMIVDEVVYDQYRGYSEKQIIQLTLEDGSKHELNYSDFTIGKQRKQEPSEIVSRKKDEAAGTEIFSLRRISDQKAFDIDSRFIN